MERSQSGSTVVAHDRASSPDLSLARVPGASRFRVSTPSLLAVLGACILILAAGMVLFAVQAVTSSRNATQSIGHRAGPAIIAAQRISFALGDMDAQVANALLVGSSTSLGETRAQAQAQYADDRRTVTDQLAAATGNSAFGASGQASVRTLLDGLATYQGEVSALEATADSGDQPAAVNAYRAATDLMHQQLLPAAATLNNTNLTVLDAAYRSTRSSASRDGSAALAFAGGLLLMLVVTQVVAYRRSHRILNVWIAAATVLGLGISLALAHRFSSESADLHGAKADAFDSVVALTAARSVAYDANADESRYLLDQQRAASYQADFLDKSLQIVGLPKGTTIASFDATLAPLVTAARQGQVRFGGYLGTELDNITFPGERQAANEALAAFAGYQVDDRVLRGYETSGDHLAAIRFDTSSAPGQSNNAFYAFDSDLQAVTAINLRYFQSYVAAADRDTNDPLLLPGLGISTTVLLAGLGLYRRVREFL